MKITNCPNCGAPLHGMKCEYCGTELKGNFVKVDIGESPYGTLNIGGHDYKVYFNTFTCENLDFMPECFERDVNGRLIRTVQKREKRRFNISMIEA